jgi:hypothetical protein
LAEVVLVEHQTIMVQMDLTLLYLVQPLLAEVVDLLIQMLVEVVVLVAEAQEMELLCLTEEAELLDKVMQEDVEV